MYTIESEGRVSADNHAVEGEVPCTLIFNLTKFIWVRFGYYTKWHGIHPQQQSVSKGWLPASEAYFFVVLFAKEHHMCRVVDGACGIVPSSGILGVRGVGVWPEAVAKTLAN